MEIIIFIKELKYSSDNKVKFLICIVCIFPLFII